MPRTTKSGITLLLLLLGATAFYLLRRDEPASTTSPAGEDGPVATSDAPSPSQDVVEAPPDVGMEGTGEALHLHFSNAYRNDPAIGEADPLNIDRHLVRFIGGAGRTLDAALFELESVRVAEALIAASRRGVRVRIVLDDDFIGNPEVELLQKAGVRIVTDNRSAFMHNKFLIADGSHVWTGSVNATDNGAWRNNNNGLEIESREIAENYTTEFNEMFEQQLFGPRSPSNTPHTLVKLGETDIYNYFAPEDDVQGKILRFIRLAKKQIRFMAFSFTDDEIGTLMIERFREGIDVAGIIEDRGSSIQSSELPRFRTVGLPILTDANRYVMHHKVIVIDSLWTILGSYNFTASANERNDENIVILKDREIARAMLEEYERVEGIQN